MRSDINYTEIVALREQGLTLRDIARRIGRCERTVSHILRECGASTAQARVIIDRETLAQAWTEPLTLMELGVRFGVSVTTISKLAQKFKLPRKPPVLKPPENDPTPEEIAERCREIRERHYAERRGETGGATRNRQHYQRAVGA